MSDRDTEEIQDLFRLNLGLPADLRGEEYVQAILKYATRLFHKSRGSKENSQQNLSD
jgi:hypothetical protein